jgi:hypothetical protein
MSSLLNFGTILQRVFDSTSSALKITSTDMAIELSANDGDSVLTQRQTIQVAVTAGQIIDVSKYSRITYLSSVNANTATKIMLLDNVTEVNGPTLAMGVATEIAAVNLKITLAGEIVLQA